MCGGSTSVSYPGPTPQEQQLQQLQLTQLQKQSSEMDAFEPFVLQSMGLQKNSNPDGSFFYAYTPEQQALNASAKANQGTALQLQTQSEARQKQAMDGTLPISAALQQAQDLSFKSLQEDQSKAGNAIIGDNLDNAVAKTTSGNQALQALRTTYANAKNTEMNNVIQNQSQNPASYGNLYMQSGGNANPGVGGAGYAANLYSSLTPMYNSAYQPYQAQQQGQFGADVNNANNTQSFYNSMLTGLLGAGGAALGRKAA